LVWIFFLPRSLAGIKGLRFYLFSKNLLWNIPLVLIYLRALSVKGYFESIEEEESRSRLNH